ncbi:MAG TPA: AAA family ATPase [Azospira sp.]|nr:AAA family ATPase [Azospira sp.]
MKVALLTQNKELLDQVKAIVAGTSGMDLTVVSGSPAHFANEDLDPMPELLIVQAARGVQDLESLGSIATHYPRLPMIVISPDQSSDFLIRAMRVGVREVLPEPLSQSALQDALERIRQHSALVRAAAGRILAFVPSKGGSGATFLATNLAYALAEEGKRVVLIDLNLQFGDAMVYVATQSAQTTVAEVAHQIQRLDGEFFESSLLKVSPNLGILAAPESPEKAVGIRPENIERILDLARNRYDYVIVDLGMTLDPISVRVLDGADMIYMVLQMTLPFIRGAKRLMSVFDSLGYSRTKVALLVNRYQPGGEITVGDVESTLGLRVLQTIPNSFAAVADSINQGKPILQVDPRDRVSKSLREMAQSMAQKPQRSGGLLSRLFGKSA